MLVISKEKRSFSAGADLRTQTDEKNTFKAMNENVCHGMKVEIQHWSLQSDFVDTHIVYGWQRDIIHPPDCPRERERERNTLTGKILSKFGSIVFSQQFKISCQVKLCHSKSSCWSRRRANSNFAFWTMFCRRTVSLYILHSRTFSSEFNFVAFVKAIFWLN